MSDTHNSDGLTDEQLEERVDQRVEEILEQKNAGGEMNIGRRGVLGGLAAAAGIGAMSGGAAGEMSSPQEAMALGGSLDVDDAYQVAGNWYAGPESAKPTPSTSDQAFWTVTDAKSGDVLRWEHWDGSSWTVPGWEMQDTYSESFNTEKERHEQHVKREDSSGGTFYENNDLQQALNDVPSTGGAVVLPCSRTGVADEIIIPADDKKAVGIKGYGIAGMEEGLSGAIIESTISDNSKWVLTYPDALFGAHKGDGSYLRDFSIVGSGNEAGGIRQPRLDDNGGVENVGIHGVGGIGFESRSATNTFKHIGVQNAGDVGVVVPSEALFQSYRNISIEITGGDAMQINGAHHTVKNVELDLAGRHGVSVYGQNITVEQAELNKPDQVGVNVSGASILDVQKCHFKDCPTAGALINGSQVTIEDCVFQSDQSGEHIQLFSGAHRVLVRNNEFTGTAPKFGLDASATDVYIDEPTINGEQAANPGSSTYTLSFDTAFTHIPDIADTADVAINGYDWPNATTDSDGNYTSVDVTFASTPSHYTWEAIPRNVGV